MIELTPKGKEDRWVLGAVWVGFSEEVWWRLRAY